MRLRHLALVPLCLLLLLPLSPADAAESALSFNALPLPGEGGGYVLRPDTDVTGLVAGPSGSFYAAVGGSQGGIYTSPDGEYWSLLHPTGDDIISLKWQGETLYYATSEEVFYASGGKGFSPLARLEATREGEKIAAMDVTTLAGKDMLAVATCGDGAGGIYILDRGELFDTWHDSHAGELDFCRVAFSPLFATDHKVLAAGSDGSSSWLVGLTGNSSWRVLAELKREGSPIPAPGKVGFTFPDGYSNSYSLFWMVAGGTLYCGYAGEQEATVEEIAIGGKISAFATSGAGPEAWLLAGTDEGEILRSKVGDLNWEAGTERPLGEGVSALLPAPDFADSGVCYCATTGGGSGISVSADFAHSWEQCGLIDTQVSFLIDSALSPDYQKDNTLFLITSCDSSSSLWRKGEGTWRRLHQVPSRGGLDFVTLAPGGVVYMAGEDGGPTLWRSFDNGRSFTSRPLPVSSSDPILAAATDGTLFFTHFDSPRASIYRSTDGGDSFTSTPVGAQPIKTVLVSPNYTEDGIVAALGGGNYIFISQDAGLSFSSVGTPEQISAIALGPNFGSQPGLYAAVSLNRIYHLDLEKGTWTRLNGNLEGELGTDKVAEMVVSEEGVIYSLPEWSLSEDSSPDTSVSPLIPMLRSLTQSPTGLDVREVSRGLEGGALLSDISLVDNQVWVLDGTNQRLAYFVETLAHPPSLTEPQDKARGEGSVLAGGASSVHLDWQALPAATQYEWQLSREDEFAAVELEGSVTRSEVDLPPLQLATTYYWRVRATSPLPSPWSGAWSFTTILGGEVIAPHTQSPPAGATTSLRPLFQWSPIAGASGYELEVALSPSFDSPVIHRENLPGSAWQAKAPLQPGTAYYWRVRATSPSSVSVWSPTGAFITQAAPDVPAPVTTVTLTPTSIITSFLPYPTEFTFPTAPTVTTTLTVTALPQAGMPPALLYGVLALVSGTAVTSFILLLLMLRRR